MTAADPSAALASYLKTTTVGSLTSGRVFRPELDEDLTKAMPVACVVIRRAGGYQRFGRGTVPVGDPRLDVFCYGATALDAEKLAGEVIVALRALRTKVFSGVRLMSAAIEGGPMPLVDPETNWPCSVLSTQVVLPEARVA